MAVSLVSSTDFRVSLLQPQNSAPEAEEPFSLLLNSVADVKATAQRPEAPLVQDRRRDAPAKQPKPQTDPDRQAKRQARETGKPEAKEPAEKPATSAKPESENAGNEGDEVTAVDPLLVAALSEPESEALPPVPAVSLAEGEAIDLPAAGEVPEGAAQTEAPVSVPAIAAAIGDANVAGPEAAPVAAQAAQTVEAASVAKPQIQAAQAQADADVEFVLPKVSPDMNASTMKPSNPEAASNAPMLPPQVPAHAAAHQQRPAQLEMLHAAISKHTQLAIGHEAGEAAPEAQKPLVSSNAVAPNFAMTAQVQAPVQLQTQQVSDVARTVPIEQVAVEIATRAAKGERRFDIRLDPPELGRIDVRLEIDSKGHTTTKLVVERAETLDMLQRDARGLEKALQNAGLKTDAGSMQFSLQQDTQAHHGHQNHAPETRGRSDLVQAESQGMSEVSINNATLAAQLRGGVDIRI